MNRIEKYDEEMIDLGAVSIETKGMLPLPATDTDHVGSIEIGISND